MTLTEKETKEKLINVGSSQLQIEKLEEDELLRSLMSSHYYKCFLLDDG